VSKGMSATRNGVGAVLGSGAMILMTAGIIVLHGIMYSVATASGHSAPAAALYLWAGTAEAAATAAAAGVLYRGQWNRLTPARWLIVGLGAVSVVVTLALWVAFWSSR
jgi:hypothetical protein